MLETFRVPLFVTCSVALAIVAACSGGTPVAPPAEAADASPDATTDDLPAADAATADASPKPDAGGDAGCARAWAISGVADADDPAKLGVDASGGGLHFRIDPGSTNNGVLMGATLDAPLVAGDFVIEVAYRDFVLTDDRDIASVNLRVSLVEEPFVAPSYDYAMISATVSKTTASVSSGVYDDGQNASESFADKPTPAQIGEGRVRLARSSGQLTLQLEAGGKTWSQTAPFGLPSLALKIELGNGGSSAGKLTIDRVAIGTASAPESAFVDDFTCDSRLP